MQRKDIEDSEQRLKRAMLESDVMTLSDLLSDSLIFVNHLGQRIGKAADIAMHQAGQLKLGVIELSETQITLLADSAIVQTNAAIEGRYEGQEASGEFVFTRVWARENNMLRVVAAHASLLLPQNG